MRKSKVLTPTQWPTGLEPLKMWLITQGVDLDLRRHESEVLELAKLIGNLRFSAKQRSKFVRERLLIAQDRLTSARTGLCYRGKGGRHAP